MTVLMCANGEILAGALAWDESVFFRHTVELGGQPLAADDVRHAVLVALETVAGHAVALAHALTGRKAA